MGLIKTNRPYLSLLGILLVVTLANGCEGTFTPKPGNNPDAVQPDSANPAAIVYRPTIQTDIETANCSPAGSCHAIGAGGYTVIPSPQNDTDWEANYQDTVAQAGSVGNSPLIDFGKGDVSGHEFASLPQGVETRWTEWIQQGTPYQEGGN